MSGLLRYRAGMLVDVSHSSQYWAGQAFRDQ